MILFGALLTFSCICWQRCINYRDFITVLCYAKLV